MQLAQIVSSIHARQILTSRGHPTVEVEFAAGYRTIRSSVPSGMSTGLHERPIGVDNGDSYNGRSVMNIVNKINQLAFQILEAPATSQEEFDAYIEMLDRPERRANFTLPLSIGFSKAIASHLGIPLHVHIRNELFGAPQGPADHPRGAREAGYGADYSYSGRMPSDDAQHARPDSGGGPPFLFFNILNGGLHSGNGLWCQEIMVKFMQEGVGGNIETACVFYEALREAVAKRYGRIYTSVGDEGGFAPPVRCVEEGMELIIETCGSLGIAQYGIALDFAANSVYKQGRYAVTTRSGERHLSGGELCHYYMELIRRYPAICSIEDPFHEEDIRSWDSLYGMVSMHRQTGRVGGARDAPDSHGDGGRPINIVADDLTVTKSGRIQAYSGAFNTVLIKPNQVGTVSGTYCAIKKARECGCRIKISHRSAETEDTFICHLAAGAMAEYAKFGAPCRGERTAKYNEMLRLFERQHMAAPRQE